jgi:hypothetical protein
VTQAGDRDPSPSITTAPPPSYRRPYFGTLLAHVLIQEINLARELGEITKYRAQMLSAELMMISSSADCHPTPATSLPM